MISHLRYLRYVLLHKWYVFRAGLLIGPSAGTSTIAWVWRLIVHDLSKFRPSEWRPYVGYFYGPQAFGPEPRRAFQYAWLRHIQRNPHHWQHWVLHEDSGKTLVLKPRPADVHEMVADWIGAGTKVLKRPTMVYCVAETIKWYAANHQRMLLRADARTLVEAILVELSKQVGLTVAAEQEIAAARASRSTLTIKPELVP